MGQERLGGDLSIAVDPSQLEHRLDRLVRPRRRRGGHGLDAPRPPLDRPRPDLVGRHPHDHEREEPERSPWTRTGRLGPRGTSAFTGSRWVTQLELTANAWAPRPTIVVLHTAPSATPARTFLPYLGDYIRLLAVGTDFYGVFCGNNTPGQRELPERGRPTSATPNFTTRTLLAHGRRDAGRRRRSTRSSSTGRTSRSSAAGPIEPDHRTTPVQPRTDRAGDPDQADLARADRSRRSDRGPAPARERRIWTSR